MAKQLFNWPLVIAVLATATLMSGVNAFGYRDSVPAADKIVTDKSNRSLIKEVLINQRQMMSQLKSIQSSCKSR